MRVLEQSEIKLDLDDLDTRTYHARKIEPRSSGLHLSAVIRAMLQASGKLKSYGDDSLSEEFPLRMAVGMAWEDFAVTLYEEMIWQPGECCKDGIYASPDGISPVDGTTHLEEFKATWKSMHTRTDITQELGWMWQLMGYCHMLKLTRARLHVLWVNGNYRGSGPMYVRYTIQFTERELKSFWAQVLNNRENCTHEKH